MPAGIFKRTKEYLTKLSNSAKRRWADKDERDRVGRIISKILKGKPLTEKHKNSIKKSWEKISVKNNHKIGNKKRWKKKSEHIKHSISIKKSWEKISVKNNHKIGNKKRWAKPEEHVKASVAQNNPYIKKIKQNASRIARIKYLSNYKYNHKHISKPEKIMYETLKKYFKGVIRQKPLGFCVVDNYIPELNLVIEVYGNYSHANPDKYKSEDIIYGKTAQEVWRRDKKRIKRIKKLGYKVIIFWEDEIYNNINSCIEKIKRRKNG